MKKQLKCYIYTRVSTSMQVESGTQKEAGVISIMPAKIPHEVKAGDKGLYLFAKFMPALC